jgi:hypothetical protein
VSGTGESGRLSACIDQTIRFKLEVQMTRRFVLMLMAVVLAAGCGQSTVPETDPYIRGTVTRTDGPSGAVLVQATDPAARVESAWVRVDERTRVERKSLVLRAEVLAIGEIVSVWTTGVEMRSLPVQVVAARIAVE